VIAGALDVGYIDNLTAAFWRAPVAGLRLSRKVGVTPATGFGSQFGRTAVVGEPHEFGYFWNHHLAYPDLSERGPDHEAAIDWDRLRRVLVNMAKARGAPMVFKPMLLIWHMEAMARVMPRSCYVWIHRDPRDTALSILRMRRAVRGSVDEMGLPASAPAERQPDPYRQVAAQVLLLERTIRSAAERLGPDTVMPVRYERLCAEPNAVVAEIRELMGAKGHAPALRLDDLAPFSPGPSTGLEEHGARLDAALAECGPNCRPPSRGCTHEWVDAAAAGGRTAGEQQRAPSPGDRAAGRRRPGGAGRRPAVRARDQQDHGRRRGAGRRPHRPSAGRRGRHGRCRRADLRDLRRPAAGRGGGAHRRGAAPRLTRKAEAMVREAGLTDLSSLPLDRFITQRDIEELIARTAAAAPVEIDPALAARITDASLVVFGGGGLGRCVIEMVRAAGLGEPLGVIDDGLAVGEDVLGVPVLGGTAVMAALAGAGLRRAARAVGGIGRMSGRVRVAGLIADAGLAMPVLIDPSATVSPSAVLEDGAQVHVGARVMARAHIGRNALINTGAIISHDCAVGEHAHIAPGAILAGDVHGGRRHPGGHGRHGPLGHLGGRRLHHRQRRAPAGRRAGGHPGGRRAGVDRQGVIPPAAGAPVAPAVVLQASGPNGLGIIRALARVGIPVVACDRDPRALGLLSRHARPCFTRDPLTDPAGFTRDVLALGDRLPVPGVLFATHDEALQALGPHEDALAARFLRPWSPWPVMRRAMDKQAQHDAARAVGFAVPATVTPGAGEDPVRVAAAAGLRYPVILKPRAAPAFRRRFRAQVLRCAGPGELRRAWEAAAPYDPQVCEVIPGGDERIWTLGSYRDAAGRPLASFTGRKLRQWPPGFGTGRAAEAHWDPAYAERGHALLDALGFHGLSQLETKRDPRDGRDHLIEVNTRSWLWVGLAAAAGVNLPLAAYLDAVGRPRRWPPGHRGGLRWMLGTRHVGAGLMEVARGEWTLGELAATLRPPLREGVWDLRDPAPGVGPDRPPARNSGVAVRRRLR